MMCAPAPSCLLVNRRTQCCVPASLLGECLSSLTVRLSGEMGQRWDEA